MTHDKTDVLASFVQNENIMFRVLSDAKTEIVPAFGLVNERFEKGSAWYGTAHPMIFVVNPKGVITHRFSGTSVSQRPAVNLVLGTLKKEAGG